jgi:hypothetical protein
VLVIDAKTEVMRTIECGVEGQGKFISIAAVDNKLFCTPYNASSVLVVDIKTEAMRTIACGVEGGAK